MSVLDSYSSLPVILAEGLYVSLPAIHEGLSCQDSGLYVAVTQRGLIPKLVIC